MKTNAELRKVARKALDGNWCKAVWVTFLVNIVISGLLYCLSFPDKEYYGFGLILCLPLLYGYYIFFLEIVRQRVRKSAFIFTGYRHFPRITLTMLLQAIYTMLWSLLLIIPGIVKGFSYAMTPFILRDHPEMKYNDAINESIRLMKGKKMKLFMLYLSFIGWFLLCLLSFGIGVILLIPYIRTAEAAFYEDIVEEDHKENHPENIPFKEDAQYFQQQFPQDLIKNSAEENL